MTDLIISTLTQGLIYALVAFGVYITYTILDFPDLSTDGSFPLGAAVTAVLLVRGVSPWAALAAAVGAGILAGLVTGIIHVVFHVRNLLAGIITQTALFSINLLIAGASNVPIGRGTDTIFTSGPAAVLKDAGLGVRRLVVSLVLVLVVKIALDLYFRTKSGLLLRAVGDNSTLVTSLGRNMGSVKIKGLALANALVALAGGVVCQADKSFTATMGTGQVVFGLASVIIGISLFRKLSFIQGTTAVLVGSILYKACIQAAMQLGFDPFMLKFITAALFLLVLILSGRKGEAIIHA
mgnify:CR=1 FL=1